MLLMIDNYDSFTYTLVNYFEALGASVKVVKNDEVSIEDIELLDPKWIVISPGPCTPNEAGVSLEVIEHFAGKTPILGVCLGHQAIGQVFGADVIKAPVVMHGKTSKLTHEGQGVFEALPSEFMVTRYHSLALDPKTLPRSLEITAWLDEADGQRTIMGVRHKTARVEGVQFHPESVLTENGYPLLKNFLNYNTATL